ncbi:hypothetical protein ACFXKW_35780 [Streptomyces sp. NPDC059193]|uniref:hypothetical protein n=1 Tax=Streptomyces sp. NPDC059193 TaxID=3346763 RepID=UPI0036C2380B
MEHVDESVVKMACLFDPEPERWGLRGDPYLWRALRDHLSDMDVPAVGDEVVNLLHVGFREVVGLDLINAPASPVFREQFSHGGLSSGMVSVEAWRDILMPLLTERARNLLAP